MTTTELIKWASKAQDLHETAWNDIVNKYLVELHLSIEETKPPEATEVEFEMVQLLLEVAWNEVIQWKTTLKL